MTSFTHFYRNSLFARVSINLIIFLLVYLAVVRPLRMQVTEKVVHPVLSTLFSDSVEDVLLSTNGASVQMKFQGIDGMIRVSTPFGVLWGIPIALLALTRSWGLAKTLTYYHITVTFILPILLLLFFIRWVWTFVPNDIFNYLAMLLGFIFCVIALMKMREEHTAEQERSPTIA